MSIGAQMCPWPALARLPVAPSIAVSAAVRHRPWSKVPSAACDMVCGTTVTSGLRARSPRNFYVIQNDNQ